MVLVYAYLSDALVLISIDHPRHNEVFEIVRPFLDSNVREDFERLRLMRRVEDRLRETESTINRLRSLLSPILSAIFAVSGQEDSVDFRDLIRRKQVSLWNLRPGEGFSHDQKRTFAQLVIHMVLETMLATPRDQRVPHVLIIEEAAEVINEELLWALGAMRKTGLSIIAVGQDVSSFRREGKFDMAPKLFSQSNIVCFNQVWPADTELLARILCTGDMDFTPLVHEHDRPDGYDWHKLVEYSVNQSASNNWGKSDAHGATKSVGVQNGVSQTNSENWTRSQGTSSSATSGTSMSTGGSEGSSQSENESPILQKGKLVSTLRLHSTGRNASTTHQEQQSESHANGSSSSQSEGGGRATALSQSHSRSSANSETLTNSAGGAEQRGLSASIKHLPLARHRTERQLTGRLESAPNDQLEKFRQRIATLPSRRAIVRLQNQTNSVEIETLPFPDAFISPTAQLRATEWIKREIFSIHSYNYVPDFRPDADESRLQKFLAIVETPEESVASNVSTAASEREPSPLL